jgi:hypothetical protein
LLSGSSACMLARVLMHSCDAVVTAAAECSDVGNAACCDMLLLRRGSGSTCRGALGLPGEANVSVSRVRTATKLLLVLSREVCRCAQTPSALRTALSACCSCCGCWGCAEVFRLLLQGWQLPWSVVTPDLTEVVAKAGGSPVGSTASTMPHVHG